MRRVIWLGVIAFLMLTGCADAPEPPRPLASGTMPEPRADWSTGLPGLLPGIRACLADDAGGAVGVTKAWPMGLRLVGVRVLRGAGERVDCVAAESGDRVFLTERVPAASRLPGENDPLFTPSNREPPGRGCQEIAAIADGWLTYDACRDPRAIGSAARRQPPAPASPGLPQES